MTMTATTPAQPRTSRVSFGSTLSRRPIRKLGIVGGGDVLRSKIWPALQSGDYPLDLIAVFSLESECRLTGLSYVYQPVVPGNLLPLDYLHERGLLGDDAAWIVATPSDYHILYTLQLAGRCRRIAIEKPLASTARQARILLPLMQSGEIYPISHKLFNVEALAFVELCRQHPAILDHVTRIEAAFNEPAGFAHGRKQEDTVSDIQYHTLLVNAAFFRATGYPFEVMVERVQAASHDADPEDVFQTPEVWTASRIRGRVLWREREIPFDFRQAKAAPKSEKNIRLLDRAGNLIKHISLDETGWLAHARVLDAFMQPVVDMRHTIEDAVAVMELIDWSRLIASKETSYEFGAVPVFEE